MDCAERGWIDGRVGRSGRRLRFGDGEAVLDAIAAIVDREGLGELLALGSRRAAERIGGEAAGLAPHVKGLELPGYDPRALHTMALGLAVGTRGPTTTARAPTRPTSPTGPTAAAAAPTRPRRRSRPRTAPR